MRKIMTAGLMAMLLAGCASSGQRITQDKMDQVINGQTTRSDLITLFGAPTTETYNSDGSQLLAWGYAHIGFMGIGTEVQSLSVKVGPDGRVDGFSRTGSTPQPARLGR
ncbi:hypothetical protein [Pseudomonas sp. AN-1]|uniref:hypothetical protein n=1 Tax=Pseudomonas sp. AN-1 TaxID=3096605 RepID=UPI002A6B59EF|nr:hypothetical protein [Pseudomonas sp. AN-1]WPP47113.1 hypothetical protein SK095_06900 [Pseudomonas sp. AN-1]